jgi:hypothetical protein
MWRRVDLVWTDVSKECSASIFMVKKSASKEPHPRRRHSSEIWYVVAWVNLLSMNVFVLRPCSWYSFLTTFPSLKRGWFIVDPGFFGAHLALTYLKRRCLWTIVSSQRTLALTADLDCSTLFIFPCFQQYIIPGNYSVNISRFWAFLRPISDYTSTLPAFCLLLRTRV